MGTISVSLPSDGTTADVADFNTPINTIVNEINGELDNANIASDAAIDGSKLANASITNAKLSTTAGDIGGAWTDWTPTWTSLSGATKNYAKYTRIGNTVHFRLKYTLTGTNVSGGLKFTLPLSVHSDIANDDTMQVVAQFKESGSNIYPAYGTYSPTDNCLLRPLSTSLSYSATGASTSSTIPFTWKSGDTIVVAGTYDTDA